METVKLQEADGVKVDEVKYLRSTIQSNVQCTREVKKGVQAVWNGQREVSRVILR